MQVIQSWNDLHSANRKVVLLPLRWETHSAPEYGVRPQESINRAIVNDCDLLVGIFWTRIGSPTGVADSGTLEEIDRVGKAGKPVMLYFSRVPIDPEGLDLKQVEKLKDFRLNTYPKGIVESFKSRAEFRDKINRQLEMKVRDLQANEISGHSPLSFSLISNETGQPAGSAVSYTVYNRSVSDLDGVPIEHRDAVETLINKRKKLEMTLPIIVGFRNSSNVAIRNVFVDVTINSNKDGVTMSGGRHSGGFNRLFVPSLLRPDSNELFKSVESIFADYESEGFRELDGGWQLSTRWDAIQPQRYQLARPAFFLMTEKSTKILLQAKIYSDSLSAPSEFSAEVEVEVKSQKVTLAELIPDWQERIKSRDSGITFSEWMTWDPLLASD